MRRGKTWTLRLTRILVLVATTCASAEEKLFEEPQVLAAEDFVPAQLLSGEHFSVEDRFRNDGYVNYYVIRSDFGDFEAVGNRMLTVRVQEVGALASLDEFSRTRVFLEAALQAGIDPLLTIESFAEKPVQTIKGIPRGIGHMFARYYEQAKEGAEAVRDFAANAAHGNQAAGSSTNERSISGSAEALAKRYLGVNRAHRNWSMKLETDPYSTNPTLRAAIDRFAWAERLGTIGMNYAHLPTIEGAATIGKINEIVWSKDPYEIRELNRKKLVIAGADSDLVDAFLDNELMTPTQRTELTASVVDLDEVSGRGEVLRHALHPNTEHEINFFVQSVAMLAWYHTNQNALELLLSDEPIPVGLKEDGGLVMMFAADHLLWTETVANSVARYAREGGPHDEVELWLLGTASQRTIFELTQREISLRENVSAMMRPSSQPR